MFPDLGRKGEEDLIDRYAPDLAKDPVLVFLHRTFLWQNLLLGAAIMGLGYAIGGDLYTAIAYVAWGVFARMVYVLHITWFVNSASHIWGYRNYETSDQSRNLWWVGLTAFGEGWHNNHHAYQRLALHGHKWWEFDMTYRAIWLMEKVGLAWNVVKTIPKNAKPA